MRKLIAILLGVALAGSALAASLMPPGKQAYWDANGNPLAGGKVYTYAAGTSTPLATYSDQAGTVPNPNPVVLDARGEATIFWGAGPYKVTINTSANALVWTQDYLYPPFTAAEPLKLYSGGNVSTPELTWTGDTDTGFYRIGSGAVGLTLNGTQHLKCDTTENVFALQTYSNVSFGAPSHWGRGGGTVTFGTFDFYDAVFSTSGIERMRIAAAGDATFAGSVTVSGVATFGPSVLTSTVTWLNKTQLPPVDPSLSVSTSYTFTTTSASLVDVTQLTTTITTHGRPVLVLMQGAPGATDSRVQAIVTGTDAQMRIAILRDGAVLTRSNIDASVNGATSVAIQMPCGVAPYLDVAPPAGTHTYKVQANTDTGSSVSFNNCVLVVWQL